MSLLNIVLLVAIGAALVVFRILAHDRLHRAEQIGLSIMGLVLVVIALWG